MDGRAAESVRAERGTTLVVVLWVLVALSALALSASIGAVVDLRLTERHREHAAALAAAEAGLADALAALAIAPSRALGADSVTGAEEGAAWVVRWTPDAGAVRILATGRTGSALRELDVRAVSDPGAGWRVAAWREVR